MPENSFLNDQYWVIISNLYSWLAVNTKSLLKSPLTFLLGILESTHHCRFDTLMKMMTPNKIMCIQTALTCQVNIILICPAT